MRIGIYGYGNLGRGVEKALAKNPDAEEIKYEISDLLYHMMVLMAERGVTWEDVTRELAERR